jgi:hypothetical protein
MDGSSSKEDSSFSFSSDSDSSFAFFLLAADLFLKS